MASENLGHYLGLPYTAVVKQDSEGDFVARVEELPGCSAHGHTPSEALVRLEEAKQLWLSDALEAGDVIPEPTDVTSLPSGKWVQRVPRSLHLRLSSMAKQEKVSLNQLVTAILAQAAGARLRDEERSRFVKVQHHAIWWESVSEEERDPNVWHISHSRTGSPTNFIATIDRLSSLIPNTFTLDPEEPEHADEEEPTYRTRR